MRANLFWGDGMGELTETTVGIVDEQWERDPLCAQDTDTYWPETLLWLTIESVAVWLCTSPARPPQKRARLAPIGLSLHKSRFWSQAILVPLLCV